jgi:hypothetical protein
LLTDYQKGGVRMKKMIMLCVVLLFLTGCSWKFWAGTGTGVVGAGAAYEINFERQMNVIDEDLKDGKITQSEYDIRHSQIKRDSLIK